MTAKPVKIFHEFIAKKGIQNSMKHPLKHHKYLDKSKFIFFRQSGTCSHIVDWSTPFPTIRSWI